jgi:hypothetical protein
MRIARSNEEQFNLEGNEILRSSQLLVLQTYLRNRWAHKYWSIFLKIENLHGKLESICQNMTFMTRTLYNYFQNSHVNQSVLHHYDYKNLLWVNKKLYKLFL